VNCYNCGAETDPAQKFCEGCGAKQSSEHSGSHRMTDDPGAGTTANGGPPSHQAWPGRQPTVSQAPSPAQPVTGPAVTGPTAGPGPGATLPGSPIRLGDGERVLRQYHAVQLRTRKRGEGTLYVTDARIVFFARAAGRGAQRASSLMQQTRLEDVCGLQAFVSRRTNILLLLFTVFMGLAALISLATGQFLPFIVFFLIVAISVFAMYNGAAERGRAGVKIQAREAQEAMGYGRFEASRSLVEAILSFIIFPLLVLLRTQNAFDVQFGRPGPDSDLVIAELGALVLDLQTRGEMAVAYWAGPAVVPAARSAATVPATTAGSPSQVLS
jgi:hypothetical protein